MSAADDIRLLQLDAIAEGADLVAMYAGGAVDAALDSDIELLKWPCGAWSCPSTRPSRRGEKYAMHNLRNLHTREGCVTYLAQNAEDWSDERNAFHEACTPKPRFVTPRNSYTAPELQAADFPPIKFVVPGYVVEGLTLVAGKPKFGKSWLLLHAAVAVSRGGYTLGDIHCIEGDVLYCALEDNPRRLKRRMKKLLGSDPWPARLKSSSCRASMPVVWGSSGSGSRASSSRALWSSIRWPR